MMTLLTTREVQELIKVDRSTIYRMAESGRLPAIKVGRQWRFPAGEIEAWLRDEAVDEPTVAAESPTELIHSVAEMLAEATGVMVMVTDMSGEALAPVCHPNGLFESIQETPGLAACVAGWRRLADDVGLQPRFVPTPLGFECARSFFRSGDTLKGMIIAGGIAPRAWPPGAEAVEQMADALGVEAAVIQPHLDEIYTVDEEGRRRVLDLLPAAGRVLSQIMKRSSL